MPDPPAIYVISGPMAAGKTTVGRVLAGRFERGVHLEGDLFRRSIVRGRVEMTSRATEEALEQLRLRYRLAAAAADTYFDAGFTVVFEDVIAPQSLGALEESIRGRPRHVIVLLPSLIALAAREAERAYKGYGSWTIAELHAAFAGAPERIGLWLDSSELTAQETADRILQATSSAGAA